MMFSSFRLSVVRFSAFLLISSLFGTSQFLPSRGFGVGLPVLSPPPASSPARDGIPNFSHIIIIVFENLEFDQVIGNTQQMPNFNQLARRYTLLTGYYAITHPSLPNYLALIGGDTFGVTDDCDSCFFNTTSLPDLVEASQRTWKAYYEDLPAPCVLGDHYPYNQALNPFVYFDPVRLNPARCEHSVVPLTQLDQDLSQDNLPDFTFIVPNLCNNAHDCGLDVADRWLGDWVGKIQEFSCLRPAQFDRDHLRRRGDECLLLRAGSRGRRPYSDPADFPAGETRL